MSAHTPGQESGRWMTQQEAAQELGISTEAVRMRVRRGSLDSCKDESGKVVVWVIGHPVGDHIESAQATGQDMTPEHSLVEALETRIESLERSLEHERESSRRKDHIIAGLVQRVPELEAPDSRGEESYDNGHESRQEPLQHDKSPDERDTPTKAPAEPQTGSQRPVRRAPWWRRIFGP